MAANDGMTGNDLTKALVISASEENRAALSEALAADGFVPALCSSVAEAREFIETDDTEIVFCDDCLHDGTLKSEEVPSGHMRRVAHRRRRRPALAQIHSKSGAEFVVNSVLTKYFTQKATQSNYGNGKQGG